jgi:glycosyltransferase involved in cell wall biosynthesis
MKRILHLIVGLGPGGAEAMLTNLVTTIDASRFESIVVSLTDRGVRAETIERHGVRVVTIGMQRGVGVVRGLVRLRRVLRDCRPDLVQSWMYHSDVLAVVASTGMKIPILWNVRCSNMNEQQASFRARAVARAAAFLSRRPAGAIVNSIAGRDYHKRLGFHVREWYFIANGVDTQRFRPDAQARKMIRAELGLDDDTLLVGMLARFDVMKDHVTFFAAASETARRTSAHFLVAGAGTESTNERIVALAATPELKGRLHFLGYRSDNDRIMAALDVHVLSSVGEGFPNVLAEAMACGALAISTDVGDARIIAGDAGLIVPVGDSGEMARAMQRLLLLPPDARVELSARGRERIVQHFALAQAVAHYESVYHSILSATPNS